MELYTYKYFLPRNIHFSPVAGSKLLVGKWPLEESHFESKKAAAAAGTQALEHRLGRKGGPAWESVCHGLRWTVWSFQLCSLWIANLFCYPQAFRKSFLRITDSLITMGHLRPGNVICRGRWERHIGCWENPVSRPQGVTCPEATLWSRDTWLAKVVGGHQNRFGKHVSFPWDIQKTPEK